MNELKGKILSKLDECRTIIQKAYPEISEKLNTVPTVDYSLRGRCAGKAFVEDWCIKLNWEIATQNEITFVNRTVPHEYAHLVVGLLSPGSPPHGWKWKSIMRLLGVQPQRLHEYDLSNVRLKGGTFLYQCSSCREVIALTFQKHRNENTTPGRYRHRTCTPGFLTFIKQSV